MSLRLGTCSEHLAGDDAGEGEQVEQLESTGLKATATVGHPSLSPYDCRHACATTGLSANVPESTTWDQRRDTTWKVAVRSLVSPLAVTSHVRPASDGSQVQLRSAVPPPLAVAGSI